MNFLEFLRLRHGYTKSHFARLLGYSRQRYQAIAQKPGIALGALEMWPTMDALGYTIEDWTRALRAFYVKGKLAERGAKRRISIERKKVEP